jgi:hypothetical protein
MVSPSETRPSRITQRSLLTSRTRPENPENFLWNSLPLEALFGGKKCRSEYARTISGSTTGGPRTQRAPHSPCHPRAAPRVVSLGTPPPGHQRTSLTRSAALSPQTKQREKWMTCVLSQPVYLGQTQPALYLTCTVWAQKSPSRSEQVLRLPQSPPRSRDSSPSKALSSRFRLVSGFQRARPIRAAG